MSRRRIRRVFRSAVTGRWVKAIFGRRHKRTTVEEHYDA